MKVRPCLQSDLTALEAALPIHGRYGHAYRLREQSKGRWLYLVALDPNPIGSCLVHWAGPVDDQVRRQLPDVVEVASLHVATEARGRGAGRALLTEAEGQVAARGHEAIGVGVADDNPDARRLYERLGFAPSAARYRVAYTYTDGRGARRDVVEDGNFLVKSVTPSPRRPVVP